MRDYALLLENVRFWDKEAEEASAKRPLLPALDAVLQIRGEVIELCKWIEAKSIRSYLEVGTRNGRLLATLNSLFEFDVCAASDSEDHHRPDDFELELPENAAYFQGSSKSPLFANWANSVGPFELALIHAERSYETLERNFETQCSLGTKHIALVGIADRSRYGTAGSKFWKKLNGDKKEILRPHDEAGYGHSTIGIGIWSREED